MKIGVFTEAYTPIVSGVVTSTRLLLAELHRRGHDVRLYTPRHPAHPTDEPWVSRFPSICFPVNSWIPITVPYSRRLLREIREAGFDVFHTQQPFIMGRLARYLARESGAPLVCTIHTQYEHYVHYVAPTAHRVAKAAARYLVRSFCNTCDVVTTPAKGMEKLLRSYGVTKPIYVIPNGIDLEPYKRADGTAVRTKLGIPSDAVMFSFVGRLAKEKNLPVVLRAVSLLKTEAPKIVLVLIGDGPERPSLQQMAQTLGVAEHVVFAGRVPHTETPSYHAASDAFVMPSITEVNPYAVIEALAGGTPAVAADSFGMREILTDNQDALLVPPEPEAFAEAMRCLAKNENLRNSMSEAARAKAQQYSIQRCAERFLEIYAGALDKR